MPDPTESLLHHQLREATWDCHETVNRHPLLAPLHQPRVGLLSYSNALCALHGMVAAVEPAIRQFVAREPRWHDGSVLHRQAALESDLAVLGRAPVASEVIWPAIGDAGDLFGLLYVLEGASLGGEWVARQVRERGMQDLPTAYFDIHGGQARPHWERFLVRAAHLCPQPQYPDAVATAVALFVALASHLDTVQCQLQPQPQLPLADGRPLSPPR